MKTNFKFSIRAACHSFAGAVCAGAILLLGASAPAQNLFVADGQPGTGYLTEITPEGTPSLFAYVSSAGLSGLAFNSAGDLFVADRSGNIYEYTPSGASSTFASGLFLALPTTGMAFDSAGNLYVSSIRNSIIKITPGGTQSTFVSGLDEPVGLVFNRAGDLFEADYGSGNIYEFINNNGTLSSNLTVFCSGLSNPSELAINSAGDLFMPQPGAGGSSLPYILEITPTGATNVFFVFWPNRPGVLAVNSADDLFVVLQQPNGFEYVAEFTPNGTESTFSSGDLFSPSGMAFQPVPSLQGVATNGTFQLTVTMPSPYYTMMVQASTNMLNWVNVCTNTPPFTFTDSVVAGSASRFYRGVLDTNFY